MRNSGNGAQNKMLELSYPAASLQHILKNKDFTDLSNNVGRPTKLCSFPVITILVLSFWFLNTLKMFSVHILAAEALLVLRRCFVSRLGNKYEGEQHVQMPRDKGNNMAHSQNWGVGWRILWDGGGRWCWRGPGTRTGSQWCMWICMLQRSIWLSCGPERPSVLDCSRQHEQWWGLAEWIFWSLNTEEWDFFKEDGRLSLYGRRANK